MPQIGKENLHTVPERKNGSPQEKSWAIVTEQLSACYVSNNNAEPTTRLVRKGYSHTIRKYVEEQRRG